jgi:hypothetical protein
MRNQYIPEDNPISLLSSLVIQVNIAMVGESEPELEKVYTLTDNMGHIVTLHELLEILTAVKPFYDKMPDREIIKYNNNICRKHTPTDYKIDTAQIPGEEIKGFVYLLQCGSHYKIGASKNVDRRITQLATLPPFDLERICIIETEDMFGLEASLHEKFSSKRERGEWFRLDAADIDYTKGLGAQDG